MYWIVHYMHGPVWFHVTNMNCKIQQLVSFHHNIPQDHNLSIMIYDKPYKINRKQRETSTGAKHMYIDLQAGQVKM